MTLDRVPWFGRHVENLGDVIIYPVLVVARTGYTVNKLNKLENAEVNAIMFPPDVASNANCRKAGNFKKIPDTKLNLGLLPSGKLMGMRRWIGSHFPDLIDYYGVAFL